MGLSMEEESQSVMRASKMHYPLKIKEEESELVYFQPKSMITASIGTYM